MLFGAVVAASTESIELDGHNLTVRRKLGGWRKEKKYQLGDVLPAIDFSSVSVQRNGAPPTRCIVFTDKDGNAVRVASGVTEGQREEFCHQICAYLKAQPPVG